MGEAGLRGNFQTMPLPDLLQWIGTARHSGILTLEKGPVSKRIFFREGAIVSSSSNDPQEFLGQFLLRHRLITEDQLRSAMDLQKKVGKLLGRVLLDEGAINEGDLTRLLKRKAEETIYSLFLWENGEFRFEVGDTGEGEAVSISLQVADVLLEGARRYDTAQRIRQDFPNDRVILKKTDKTPAKEEFTHPMVVKLYELVDGSRSIADICLELHAPEFPVSWALHKMFEGGFLVTGKDSATRGQIPTRTESLIVLVEQAKGMIEKGNFELALVLLKQIHDEATQNLEVPYLIRQAEAGFVERAYMHYLPPKKIPVLTKPLESLTTEQLTPEEGFLVSRMTGTWNIESIVSVSPLREVDVLLTLKRLREAGILELQDEEEKAAS